MIGYVTIGTNDLERGAAFYDTLAALLDTPRMMEEDSFIAWGKMDGPAGIGLTKPFNGEPATVGNGVMIALQARDPQHVDAIYKAALNAGGTDEGAPGPRGGGFYAGYFRDLDGNKLKSLKRVKCLNARHPCCEGQRLPDSLHFFNSGCSDCRLTGAPSGGLRLQ